MHTETMTLNFDPASRSLPRNSSSSSACREPRASRALDVQFTGFSLRDQPVADAFIVLTAPLASDALRQTAQIAEHADTQILDRFGMTLRRLRALWWVFEPLLDEKEARIVRKRFKQLADIAGEPHDIEAACDLLARARKSCSRVGPLVRTLKDERRDASATSCMTIRRANVDRLLRRALADARRRLEDRVENHTIEEFARQRISLADETLTRREHRAARMKHVDAKTLHSIEEAASKLHCLLELFAPVLKRGHRQTVVHLADAQLPLARLHDVLASEALVRRVAVSLDDKHAIDEAVRWLDKARRGESRAAMKRLRAVPHLV